MSVGGVGLPEPTGVLDPSGGGPSKHHTSRGAGCTQEPLSAGGVSALRHCGAEVCVLLTVSVSDTACHTVEVLLLIQTVLTDTICTDVTAV